MNQETPKVPKLRFKTFTNNWNKFNFSDVFDFKKTFAYSRDQLVCNGEGTGNIHYGDIHTKYASILDVTNVSIPKIKNSIKLNVTEDDLCKNGDLIIADASEDYKDIGKTIELSKINQNIVAGLHTFLARPIETFTAKGFPVRLMQTEKVRKQIMKCATGISVLGISKVNLSKISLYLPKTEEQMRIANFFDTIDKYIENLKSQKEELEKYKKGMMQKIFSKRFFSNEVEENELGSICKISTGKLDANAMKENGKYRFYTCAKEYYFIDSYAFDTEALLISGNGANVGYIHYYNGKFNAYQRTYVLKNFSENILFIKYFLEENLSKRINKEKKAGNTPYIVLDTLKKMKIILPNKIDQEKFVKLFLSIDKLIENKDQEIEFIETWKKGLLQQMFI